MHLVNPAVFYEQVEDETPGNLSPVETHYKEDRAETSHETTENLQQGSGNDINEGSTINENATSDEVKPKKKKKKKRRHNKTAPMEGDDYELPPLNAWDTPPGTLNGFPGSAGVSPRRLEPLGPSRLPGTVDWSVEYQCVTNADCRPADFLLHILLLLPGLKANCKQPNQSTLQANRNILRANWSTA